MLSCRDMAPWLSIHSPTTKWGDGGGARHQKGNAFPRAKRGWPVFRRPQGGCQCFIIRWRRRRRTSPAQRYYITPEGGALNPPVRRSRSQAEPLAPRAKGPAAPSTLTPVRACQPSGILESTAQVPVPIPNAPQAPEPSRPYGRVPQSFAAALAFRQSSTSFLPKSPCSCSNLATTGAVASCQRWISSFGIT